MKSHFLSLAALLIIVFACKKEETPTAPPVRYQDEVFTNVNVQTVKYSAALNLEMDIYQPAGDASENRPVVVLAHGGGFVNGNKNSPEIVRLATNLAKRGYVTVSFNYRLAPNFLSMLDSTVALEVVVRALADARAAIRFMRASAANSNVYNIYTDKIFVGGTSAGAVLALHLGYLDANDVLPPHMQTIVQNNGGVEGNSGNSGYPSNVNGVFSMAGGISRLSFIDADDVPLVSFHGVEDDVVPYECGDVFTGFTGGMNVIDLCGSKPVHEKAQAVGLKSTLNSYPGKHVPWVNETTGEPLPLFDEVERKIIDFLFTNL